MHVIAGWALTPAEAVMELQPLHTTPAEQRAATSTLLDHLENVVQLRPITTIPSIAIVNSPHPYFEPPARSTDPATHTRGRRASSAEETEMVF